MMASAARVENAPVVHVARGGGDDVGFARGDL